MGYFKAIIPQTVILKSLKKNLNNKLDYIFKALKNTGCPKNCTTSNFNKTYLGVHRSFLRLGILT